MREIKNLTEQDEINKKKIKLRKFKCAECPENSNEPCYEEAHSIEELKRKEESMQWTRCASRSKWIEVESKRRKK